MRSLVPEGTTLEDSQRGMYASRGAENRLLRSLLSGRDLGDFGERIWVKGPRILGKATLILAEGHARDSIDRPKALFSPYARRRCVRSHGAENGLLRSLFSGPPRNLKEAMSILAESFYEAQYRPKALFSSCIRRYLLTAFENGLK